MNHPLSIPPSVRDRLANPAAPGQRHAEIVRVTAALIRSGLNAEAVFCQIRPSYGADLPDSEIRGVIRWAERQLPPSGGFRPVNDRPLSPLGIHAERVRPTAEPQSLPPEQAVLRFLNGFTCEAVDLWEASPVRLTARFETDAETLLATLYRPGESINIVSHFAVSGGKARPAGGGITDTRDNWLSAFRRNGPPVSDSGGWIRLNPTDGQGISDANVAAFRFALLEFDSIPLPLQLAFVARLPLRISAIVTSGGKSIHAWVLIGAETAPEFRTQVSTLFRLTAPFGADTANRNPARLGRLPGVVRKLGGSADNRQRLIYLNPNPTTSKILS